MDITGGTDPFGEVKESREEYSVYDSHYEKIGRVDDILVDHHERATYVGVKMGFFGGDSTLIPVEKIRVNDRRRLIEVSEDRETIRHAPRFGSGDSVSPELEDRVREYFGLEPLHAPPRRDTSSIGDPYADERLAPDARIDTEPGERAWEQQEQPADPPAGEIPREGVLERPEEPAREPSGERAGETTGGYTPDHPEDRWEKRTTGSGVTVHRRSR